MTTAVYVQLLKEGTIVYRPVPASKVSENVYLLGGEDMYQPECEEWEFTPGTYVLVEEKILSDGPKLVAIRAETGKEES